MKKENSDNTVMVNENKKSTGLKKVLKKLVKGTLFVTSLVGIDYLTTGGKITQSVTEKSKMLMKMVTEKTAAKAETPVQNNNHQGGGQQRPHYENRPRPNYNGNNNRPANVVTE